MRDSAAGLGNELSDDRLTCAERQLYVARGSDEGCAAAQIKFYANYWQGFPVPVPSESLRVSIAF